MIRSRVGLAQNFVIFFPQFGGMVELPKISRNLGPQTAFRQVSKVAEIFTFYLPAGAPSDAKVVLLGAEHLSFAPLRHADGGAFVRVALPGRRGGSNNRACRHARRARHLARRPGLPAPRTLISLGWRGSFMPRLLVPNVLT